MDKNKLISEKISLLKKEGYPQKQAVAISISMYESGRLRPGGVYVKSRKRSKPKKSRKAKKSRKPKKKSRKPRRKSRGRTGARKSRGPKKGKSRKPKKKSRKRTRFKMKKFLSFVPTTPMSGRSGKNAPNFTLITKIFKKLYRSTGYEESSCNHPFFGPSEESITTYIKPGRHRSYFVTVKKDGAPFALVNLDQSMLTRFSKIPELKKFFFPPKNDSMKRVFINKEGKWQRASADSRLDCEFYNRLFQMYPNVQGFYTEPGNTPAECVLNERMKSYLTEVEKSYRGHGTPAAKEGRRDFLREGLGSTRRTLF